MSLLRSLIAAAGAAFVLNTPFITSVAHAADRPFDLVATGGAYVDFIATVPAEVVLNEGIPLDGAKGLTQARMYALRNKLVDPVVLPGGMSGNTVASLAALGGRAGFFGKVANDQAGEIFRRDFEGRGVEWCCTPRIGGRRTSGTTLVLLTDHFRSVAYYEGCSELLGHDDFDKFDFTKSAFFLVEGSQLISETLGPVVRRVVTRARGRTQIIFNLQSFEEFSATDLNRIAPFIRENADVVIGNSREQAAFTEASPTRPGQIVIETRGAGGVHVTDADGTTSDLPAIAPTTLVSSVGAGDAFTAGFLLSRARRIDLNESVRRGIAAATATAILSEVGGRLPFPTDH